jgi:hypothetical protein
LRRLHAVASWLAIVALLIDGMLPSAVSTASRPDLAAPRTLCRAAASVPAPSKQTSTLPIRHCALCAGVIAGLLPSRQGGFYAGFLTSTAHPTLSRSVADASRRIEYAAAQPRAPPVAAS